MNRRPPVSTANRRRFLQTSALTAAAVAAGSASAAEGKAEAPLKFKLGIVTYNIAKDWDVPTILEICKSVGLAAAELRTTHKHGVEPSLGKDERSEVRKRFADSGIQFWGCGSICEFQDPRKEVVDKN